MEIARQSCRSFRLDGFMFATQDKERFTGPMIPAQERKIAEWLDDGKVSETDRDHVQNLD